MQTKNDTGEDSGQGPTARILNVVAKIEAHEIRATFASFMLALVLMTAYYILRPVRDAMASDWSDAEVAVLWTINFFFSFVVVAIYGAAVSRVSLKNLVPGVYGFFALTFAGFFFMSQGLSDTVFVDKAFYVWVSLFSLFPLSVFWSLMADLYTTEQSKRLFGVITTGASVGAMVGPSITLLLTDIVGTYSLMLVASVVLMGTLPVIYYLERLKVSVLGNTDGSQNVGAVQSVGGNPLAGFKLFLQNPLLLGIGLFLFCYTGIGSFVYFELKNLMAEFSRAERTEYWAIMDLVTNTLTIVAGLFVTSRLATRLGLGATLAVIPLIVMLGMLSVAMVPALSIVVGLQVVRRGGNYAITRPAREMLYTHFDRETRFKAKQVIDVVVYRGGDVFWGWAFTGLTQVVGLGMVGVAAVGGVIAAIWAAIGWLVGVRAEALSEVRTQETKDNTDR
ncbi:MAG: AAA family ATP:ADP antiporter [Halieaceae bacterium]|jgi:AAA family ATP:ADP antiporter